MSKKYKNQTGNKPIEMCINDHDFTQSVLNGEVGAVKLLIDYFPCNERKNAP